MGIIENNIMNNPAGKLRAISVVLVGVLGNLYILPHLLLLVSGARIWMEDSVSDEEHFKRIEDGYYFRQDFYPIMCMAAYMAVFLLPHSWVTGKKIRYVIIMGMLLLPPIIKIPSFINALTPAFGIWDIIGIVGKLMFYGLPVVSLYYSWKSRRVS